MAAAGKAAGRRPGQAVLGGLVAGPIQDGPGHQRRPWRRTAQATLSDRRRHGAGHDGAARRERPELDEPVRARLFEIVARAFRGFGPPSLLRRPWSRHSHLRLAGTPAGREDKPRRWPTTILAYAIVRLP